ncbi:DUF1566 domain-containing protein [Paraburkholderia sp. WP4_3_2]|uniref:DUF1566 domain-containing protein n=1 Tax=Paraburkholderia sp. WP4_3_2 TaxID=2587162 RepID=UPI00160BD400|nr:DUF1566 domain-containing protein [Paraburkholderia sp. WP4_3_2]MBB3256902.1 hypothetical protein [Paraburkholderia sp. WP4_3_2]
MTVTLEQIEADQARISALIEEFKKQPKAMEYNVTGVKIPLAPGERYAGLVLGDNGDADYHLILLPGENESVDWPDASEWAEAKGGVLPTRREQSLLFANLKGEFESAWYWSSEQHETNSGWAWFQGFYDGFQGSGDKDNELRARAVRRFIPSVI